MQKAYLIPLSQNKIALVDEEIYQAIGNLKWTAHFDNGNWYAKRQSKITDDPSGKWHTIYMHHLVVGKPPKGFEVDHIDGNGLNNQRSNLRIVTNRDNQSNRKEHRQGHLIGTHFDKRSKKWMARRVINGKKVYLGSFITSEAAHKAYLNSF